MGTEEHEAVMMTKEKKKLPPMPPPYKDHYRDTNGAHVAVATAATAADNNNMEQNKCTTKCYCYCYSDCGCKMKRKTRCEQEGYYYYYYYCLSESAKVGLCHMIIFLVAVGIYSNSLSGDFVHDDIVAIVRNPDVNWQKWANNNNNNNNNSIHSTSSQEQGRWLWWWSVWKNDYWGMPMSSPLSHKSYRPVTVLTFRVNYWMCGNSLCPEIFHATNVLIHALVSCLLFYLCQTVLKMRLLSSLLTSLIFAVHPIHTEAVAGITGRADALACLMMLASFLLYHKLLERQRKVFQLSNKNYCCLEKKSFDDFPGKTELFTEKCEIPFKSTSSSSSSSSNFDDDDLHTGNPGSSSASASVAYDTLKGCCDGALKCQNSNKDVQSLLTSLFSTFFPFSKINGVLLITSGLVGCAAMLAKETGITVLGINLLYDLYLHLLKGPPRRVSNIHNHRKTKNNTSNSDDSSKQSHSGHKQSNACLRHRLTFTLALILISLTLRITLMNGTFPRFGRPDNPAAYSESELTRLLTYAYLPVFNMWLVIYPRTLSYDWQMGSIPLVQSIWDPRNFASALFYLVISLLTWKTASLRKSKKWRILVVALPFIVIPFAPASNLLFPVGFVVAERVLYTPSLGVCIIFVHGMESLFTAGKHFVMKHLTGKGGKSVAKKVNNLLMGILACSLLVSFGIRTWQRNRVWQSRLTLFTSGMQDVPQNAKMHYNYANLQKDMGDRMLAIQHYSSAIRLWPEYASAHNNLGTLLMANPAAAEHQFLRAIQAGNQAHGGAHFNLGVLYMQNEKYLEAALHLKKSLIIDPSHLEAFEYLNRCRNMIQQQQQQQQQKHQSQQNNVVNIQVGSEDIVIPIETTTNNNNHNLVNSTTTISSLNRFVLPTTTTEYSTKQSQDLEQVIAVVPSSSSHPMLLGKQASTKVETRKGNMGGMMMIIKSVDVECGQNFSSPWKSSGSQGSSATDKLLPSHVHYFHNNVGDKS